MSTLHALSTSAMQESIIAPATAHHRKVSVTWLVSGLMAGVFGLAAPQAQAITVYGITQIGLLDAGHTRNDGARYNFAYFLNGAGNVVGRAYRFDYDEYGQRCYDCGESVWIYKGSVTQEIGLTGAAYSRYDGFQYNRADFLNNAGQVAGTTDRFSADPYSPPDRVAQSAWFYNGSSTQEIGLMGAGHVDPSSGYATNGITSLNNAGQVIGNASRFDGAAYTGQSAWMHAGGVTQEIGLTDVGHTDTSSGYRLNQAALLNDAGQVAGRADRYIGSIAKGHSAWFYNGSSTQEIGLTDAGHTGSSGYRSNFVQLLNSSGQVAGNADRYSSTGISLGKSAWLYNGSSTQEIGLTDAGHTSSDGVQINDALFINDAGQVAGSALRYNGSWSNTGQSAWLYNGSSTQEIGLTDAEHARGSYRYNEVVLLNNAGQVAGRASRFNGLAGAGQSAWFFDGSTSQKIGLTDAGHTSSDGVQINDALFINDAGQVAGRAFRYNGAAQAGQTAWFYDSAADQTYSMDFSVSVLTGHALSVINFLGEDGLALGSYTLYDTFGTSLGNHAFSFTVADGWNDLGSLVDGGLNAAGWNSLATAYRGNGAGYIVGQGVLTGKNGQAAYLLAPVPEPETWAMLLAGLGLVGAAARRRKASVAA